MSDHHDQHTIATSDRRTVLKKAVAAGAAVGVIWTAPRIEGLTLRPNYASAQSTPTSGTLLLMFDPSGFGNETSPCGPGDFGASAFYSPFETGGIFGFHSFTGVAGTVNAVNANGGGGDSTDVTWTTGPISASTLSLQPNVPWNFGQVAVAVTFNCS